MDILARMEKDKPFLMLEDGTVYYGESFARKGTTFGEVVFNTSMAGYQEMLTDPSYSGQILVPTYPIVGNYGINDADLESKCIQIRGLVVRENCEAPNHYQSKCTLGEYLEAGGIPAISGVDTRALTRKLRSQGVMMGILTTELKPEDALDELKRQPRYDCTDFVKKVTTEKAFTKSSSGGKKYHVAVLDCGLKYNIARLLAEQGCEVSVLPVTAQIDQIESLKPDGVLLSPGPGDPIRLDYLVEKVKLLIGKYPIMGICLGHQVIARAFGAETYKLKFGHRGGNHPVKDLSGGRIYITAQNHGYAVDAKTLGSKLKVSQINLNDGTVEGLEHEELPIFTIQYHAEGSPGPMDTTFLFERFIEMMRDFKKGKFQPSK